jgi:hypothetical protein
MGRVGIEQFSKPTVKSQIQNPAGAKSGAPSGDSAASGNGFREAVSAILALPLSDSEKAEAIRRLLAPGGE